jgi:hypothetical protein
MENARATVCFIAGRMIVVPLDGDGSPTAEHGGFKQVSEILL